MPTVWERPELSKRDRSLITVVALIALNRPDQLRFHLGKAVENGVKERELVEVITHLAFYAGWPNAMIAIMVAKELFSKEKVNHDMTALAGWENFYVLQCELGLWQMIDLQVSSLEIRF